MKRWLVLLVSGLAVGAGVVGSAGNSAPGFKIDLTNTFLGTVSAHADAGSADAIHEGITRAAIKGVTPNADEGMITNILHGVENTDITHQWDSEYHFDNASISFDSGNGVKTVGFAEGFRVIAERLAAAKTEAKDNPDFYHPRYKNFADLATAVERQLRVLANDDQCQRLRGCAQTVAGSADEIRELREQPLHAFAGLASLLGAGDNLEQNPFPDPHAATGERSLFGKKVAGCAACGALGDVNLGYRKIIKAVKDGIDEGLSWEGKIDLPEINRNLVELTHAYDAYLAFQDLGHAFHTTQDFFAHTNYVELMAGVEVEQKIPPNTTIPVPETWSDFSLTGLRRLMGPERYAKLESGAVYTRWLGEGDFCAGPVNFFFNPAGGVRRRNRLAALTGLIVGEGTNSYPPVGFHYCHYHTPTTQGLNKDEPKLDEPSHANFEVARTAAVQVSSVLWKTFSASIQTIVRTVRCPQAEPSCTNTGPWSGAWDVSGQTAVGGPVGHFGTFRLAHVDRASAVSELTEIVHGSQNSQLGFCVQQGASADVYVGSYKYGGGGRIIGCTKGDTLHGQFVNSGGVQTGGWGYFVITLATPTTFSGSYSLPTTNAFEYGPVVQWKGVKIG
jgi:hypothetical protein